MKKTPRIKVVGVGGSGVNAINRMVKEGLTGVELIAVNTDAQSLKMSSAPRKVLIGRKATGGLGTGMNVRLGEKAAKESYEELKDVLKGTELVFLTCGLGGGSGTSGICVLGDIAKELGILSIAVVTLPFSFEGVQRKNVAKCGLRNLSGKVDTYLTIQNDKLLEVVSPQTTVENAFWVCDGILREAVKAIADLVSLPGIINVDFADLRGILKHSGRAFLGIGKAKGEKRPVAAAHAALQSPLLDFSIKSSEGILLNIAASEDVSLTEVHLAASAIRKQARPKTKIIFGVSDDDSLEKGEMKVILIATSKS